MKPVTRITKFTNNEFAPTPLEILAEELTEKIQVLTPKKERRAIILEFLAQKQLTGQLKMVES